MIFLQVVKGCVPVGWGVCPLLQRVSVKDQMCHSKLARELVHTHWSQLLLLPKNTPPQMATPKKDGNSKGYPYEHKTGHTDARGRLAPHLNLDLEHVCELLQKGWVVVDCISREEADKHVDAIWKDLVSMGTGVKYKDVNTLKSPNWPGAPKGLMQQLGASLWPSVAAARNATEPFFKDMFCDSDVLLSWDALAIAPPKMSKKRSIEGKDKNVPELSAWLHTDERRDRRDLVHWIQGILSLEDLGPAEIRTQVVGAQDGMTAQEFTDTFCNDFPEATENYKDAKKPKSDRRVTMEQAWCDHSREEKEWLVANGDPVTPIIKKGQMLLWCSKMPHANMSYPLPEGQDEYRTRIAILVNAIPVQAAYPGEIAKRREMLETKRTSGHQVVSEGKRPGTLKQQLFSLKPHFPGGPSPSSFDFDKATLPTMTNFKQYLKPRSEWLNPDVNTDIGQIHAKTARLCAGYDTGV